MEIFFISCQSSDLNPFFAWSEIPILDEAKTIHNGGNDSHKRQSQLWDQITCQTKTGQTAKSWQKNFCEIDWSYLCLIQQFDNFEYEEAFAKPKLLKFGKKTSLP